MRKVQAMNISDMEIGQVVRDPKGVTYRVVGLDYQVMPAGRLGGPNKRGPCVVLQPTKGGEHRHVDQKEFSEFTREPK